MKLDNATRRTREADQERATLALGFVRCPRCLRWKRSVTAKCAHCTANQHTAVGGKTVTDIKSVRRWQKLKRLFRFKRRTVRADRVFDPLAKRTPLELLRGFIGSDRHD